MAIQVTSEIGKLKQVMLHRPGIELEHLVPGDLERLLFDDIPYLKAAQTEHDLFAEILRDQGVEVVYLEDLTATVLRQNREIKKQFIEQFVREGNVTDPRSRETSYARDYDKLFDLLRHEKDHGNILWVMGPAFAFDADARRAMQSLIEHGYAHGLLAGNALATHDLEGAYLHTALGQDIYTQKSQPNGHYNHLDVCNKVRRSGSIPQFIKDYDLDDGIICACVKHQIPIVLAGSIRDDGPLPEVIGDAYEAAASMRNLIKKATTVICMATMLHTIATGNMTPSFRVLEDGTIRPLYIYTVDADEFVVNKLLDRGSLSATTVVTNVQDFITLVAKGLGVID